MPNEFTLRVAQRIPSITTPSSEVEMVGIASTVTVAVAVCAPHSVVAVMVAVPSDTAVTNPIAVTTATAELLLSSYFCFAVIILYLCSHTNIYNYVNISD